MNQIKLKAKLKAYSKTPFYTDYVRGVNVSEEGVEELLPDTLYGRMNGQWVKIWDGNMDELSTRLLSLEEQDKLTEEQLSNLNIYFDNITDKLVYIDRYGQRHEWSVESPVDNVTIRYNDLDRLEVVFSPDGKTIERYNDGNGAVWRAKALHYTEINGEEKTENYIDGKWIVDEHKKLEDDIVILKKELGDVTAYVQGDSYLGTAIDPTCLGHLYNKENIPPEELSVGILMELTKWARKWFLETTGTEPTPEQLPDNIKILDTYKGDLWILTDGKWKNNGSDLIVSATNDGVYGVVTGVDWKNKGEYSDGWEEDSDYLKGHILSEVKVEEGKTTLTAPIFNINGLADRLKDLDYTKVEKIDNKDNPYDVAYIQERNITGSDTRDEVKSIIITDGYLDGLVEHKGETLVKRTSGGTIVTNTPELNEEATNVKYINDRLILLQNKLKALSNTTYTSFIHNNGDITTAENYTTVTKGY